MFIKFIKRGKKFINVCKPILLSLCLAISPLNVSAEATTYKLIYNGNGGSGAPVVQSFSPDTGDIQLSWTIPTKPYSVFYGWSRTPTGVPEFQPASKMSTTGVSSNITLYAIWGSSTGARYLFYQNSGAPEDFSTPLLPSIRYFAYSATNTINVSDFVPVRKYNTFLGWSKTRFSTTVDYVPGATYPCTSVSTTLYPVWSFDEGSTQSMSFDKLSQPLATGIPDTILLGSNSEFFIPETIPVKSGSIFAGWKKTAQPNYDDYTLEMYLPGEPLQRPHDDLILYPYFLTSATSKIYVTYALNGGTNGPLVQCVKNKYESSSDYLDFCISSKAPKKDGFTFMGWSRNLNGPVALLAGSLTNFKPQVSFTLYAVWKALPEETPHTLTFDANGGLNCPASMPYTYNTSTIGSLYLPTEIPTLEGKDFVGWSTVKGSATAQYLAGSSWTLLNEDTTLYAVWVDKPIIRTITYDANGGTNSPDVLSYAVKPTGTVFLSTVVPVKEGYEFLGWSKTQSSISAEYPSGYAWSLGNNYDTVLYAIWKVIPTYTITYDANGGTDAPDIQSYLYNKTGTTNLSLIIPNRVGYTFEGWSTSSTGSSGTTPAGGTWSCSNVSTILYAKWKIIPITYNITYNANGGINAPAAQSYIYNPVGYMLLTSATPTREGYTFSGWARTPDAVKAEINPSSVWYYNVKENTTLYAVWRFVQPYYTISYNTNGGTGSVAPRTYQHEVEGNATDIFDLGAYFGSKTGYKFIGWSRNSQATFPEFFPDEHWDCTREGNITLYAVWINQRGVKFNLNGGSLSGVTDGEIKYGALGSSFYISEVPYKEGYTFRGWIQQGNNGVGPWGALTERYSSLEYTSDLKTNSTSALDSKIKLRKPEDCQLVEGSYVHRFQWTSDHYTTNSNIGMLDLESVDYFGGFFGDLLEGTYVRCTVYAKIPLGYNLASDIGSSVSGGNTLVGTGEYEYYEFSNYITYRRSFGNFYLVQTDSLLETPTTQNPVYVDIAYCNLSKSIEPESGLLGIGVGTYTFNTLGVDTLTAIFDEKPYPVGKSFSIVYRTDGGLAIPEVQTYAYSPTDSIALSSVVPVKENKIFLGWTKDKAATTVQYQPSSEWSCGFKSSVSLYAVWGEGVENHVLSYNPNGGINAPTNQPYVYTAGGSMLLSTNIPIKTGFKFMGWSTDVNATVAELQPGDSWSLSSSPSTTLYAVWHLELARLSSPKTLILNNEGCCFFRIKGIVSSGKVKVDVNTISLLTQNNKSPIALNIAMSGNYLTPDVSELIGTVTSEGLGAGSWSTVFNIHLSYEP